MTAHPLSLVRHAHPSPTPPDRRAALMANPGFGKVFTDHMVTIRYSEAEGWHDARVEPRGPIALDPAASVLHYAQEIFEGLKAYKAADGGATLFRPRENARRFQQSAERLAMPILPEKLFLEAIDQLVDIDRDWIPDGDGSLYIRPFMFANETFLGVKPSSDYLFIVIASSVGAYFKSATDAVSVWVSQEYTRAAPGGTGAAKCGGNYAASLLAQAEASQHGCDQVVFLDAAERKWIEELGGMNVFFAFDDGSLLTPPLGGTILPGVTRDSILTLLRDWGVKASERAISIDEVMAAARGGALAEMWGTGTAAVVSPVGELGYKGERVAINGGKTGTLTQRLYDAIVAIQYGDSNDPHGWTSAVAARL
jgi:branched-chain amino acid aminotransferase